MDAKVTPELANGTEKNDGRKASSDMAIESSEWLVRRRSAPLRFSNRRSGNGGSVQKTPLGARLCGAASRRGGGVAEALAGDRDLRLVASGRIMPTGIARRFDLLRRPQVRLGEFD